MKDDTCAGDCGPRSRSGSLRVGDAQIEAAIFDMDGLMFDTERVAVDSWVAAAEQLGYAVGREVFLAMVGTAAGSMKPILAKLYGESFPYDELRRLRLEIAALHLDEYGVPVKEGLRELLAFLRAAGIPMAVATSTNRARVEPLLARSGVAGFFQVVVCGDEVLRCKPAPEIYLSAAARLGTSPGRCLVLEDSRIGIAAAHAAGAIPVMVPDLVQPDAATLARVHGVMGSLSDVRLYLQTGRPDLATGPDRVNTKYEMPATLSMPEPQRVL